MDLLLPGMRVAVKNMVVTPDSKTGNITDARDHAPVPGIIVQATSGIPASLDPASAYSLFYTQNLKGAYRSDFARQGTA